MSERGKSLLAVAFVLCCVFGCNWYKSCNKEREQEKRIEKLRQDSIRKAFIADSLAHDPYYQDSIRLAEAKYKIWKAINDSICREEIVGFLLIGDSCYHTSIHDVTLKEDELHHSYSVYDIPNLRFITEEEAEANRYKQCPICIEMESAYQRYEDGEIIDVDDIKDYVSDNYEDFEDLFESEPVEPDFDDDRW